MMNLCIMFIQEKVYNITTVMTFDNSAVEDPSDINAITKGLAAIIANTLGVKRSDVSLIHKPKKERAEKNSLDFDLTVTTKDKAVVNSIKDTKAFIKKVNVNIKESDDGAVKGIKLSSLSDIKCEGCGK